MGEESLNLQIDKNYFAHWTEVEICLSIDTFSTFTFSAPFDPSHKEFRDTFRPFTFQRVEIDSNLEQNLIDGFIVDISPRFDANGSAVQVSGYARPAVLCDCCLPTRDTPPGSKKPTITPGEFSRFGVCDIAKRLCAPFGIGVVLRADEGKWFEKVRCGPEKRIHEFLVELAKQRNLVISNTGDGNLLIWQSVDTGAPICEFVEGKSPVKAVEAQFSPREYFSEITGMAAKKRGKSPAKWTEHNPWLSGPLRPHTFKLEDTERGDAPEATRAKMGRMFANMVSYTIPDIPTWRDPKGKIWQPNQTVMLQAPSAMIYRNTEFVVRNVKLKKTKDGETATLELVLPGAFNGKVPGRLPWDEVNPFEEAARHAFE